MGDSDFQQAEGLLAGKQSKERGVKATGGFSGGYRGTSDPGRVLRIKEQTCAHITQTERGKTLERENYRSKHSARDRAPRGGCWTGDGSRVRHVEGAGGAAGSRTYPSRSGSTGARSSPEVLGNQGV